jgi:hypothetical protein
MGVSMAKGGRHILGHRVEPAAQIIGNGFDAWQVLRVVAANPLDEIFYISGKGKESAFRFPVPAGHSKIRQKVTDRVAPPPLFPVAVSIENDPLDQRSQLPAESAVALDPVPIHKSEHMVRYYGYYSNKSRGMRKKAGSDDQVPALFESAVSSTAFRRNWARLIQKIYQIDPLLCPKCQGSMKVIAFIEDDALIRKILQHIGLWETRIHDPPQSDDTHIPAIETELTYDYTYSQLPPIDYWTQ